MSVIASIAEQRQKLLDGLKANDGDINLRIFEDFYPDEAHFIYELLQNAEDAGATEVHFELNPMGCVVEHNGTRHFDEKDIRGITGIFNSSKRESPDKIGQFGVGFKSVFVYTETPIIYSKHHSFKIVELVLPQEVHSHPSLGEKTRFELPFNSGKKDASLAFREVQAGLEQLSETTLLFLNNLRYISWRVGSTEGAVLREEHSEFHVEVLKLVNEREVVSSHWLRFAESLESKNLAPAIGEALPSQKVAVAYELTLVDPKVSFDKTKSLSSQLKINAAEKGSVSVFFPAEKETSGLRFHLHAPFVPELSRASIKNTPANIPLFDQLALLAAKSLHSVRDLGLLTGDFLSVLPNSDEMLPERYRCIRQAILNEMRQESLVPKYFGGFAPASRLIQGKASLKNLLTTEDLTLVSMRTDSPDWAIGYTQKNSNIDRFLSSLGMQEYEIGHLQGFFENYSRELPWEDDLDDDEKSCIVDQAVLDWIYSKSFEWLQSLYSLLYKHCEEQGSYGELANAYFIKLESDEIGTAEYTFIVNAVGESKPDRCVDLRVLTAGTKKGQQAEARLFLEALGIREPNEADAIKKILVSRYMGRERSIPDEVYAADLKRMIEFSENFKDRQIFENYMIFRVGTQSLEWTTSAQVYLDLPFKSTGIDEVLQLGVKTRRRPLSDWYLNCGIDVERIGRFAELLGAQAELEKPFTETDTWNNPNRGYLRQAPGQRSGNGIDRDFILTDVGLALLNAKQVKFAQIVWRALCKAEAGYPRVLKACFQWTTKGGPHYSTSQLVHSLRELNWVPQQTSSGLTYVRPSAAVASLLPDGFAVDAGYKWLSEIGFGADEAKRTLESASRAAQRAAIGINSEEELMRALEFLKLLPVDEQNRILETAKSRADLVELPIRPLRNVELRQERVSRAALEMPEKASVIRERSVQVGTAEVKAAAKVYLSDHYTNTHGLMVCQVCKEELPFKLLNGSYYFEAVEILPDAPKRFRETYLALCPNHAAAYRYANPQETQMQELIALASGTEVEITLCGQQTTIYFTQTHLADAQACLRSVELNVKTS